MNTISELPRGLINKQLFFAIPHVSSGWFPINSDLFHEIRDNLASGYYGSQVELIIEDLKCDYALYAYCIKELSLMLSTESPPEGFGPLQLIRVAGIDRISSIFKKPLIDITSHKFKEIDLNRAKQISSTMTNACTAEFLAKFHKVDPDSAFTCGLFRQLALTLIAWNYPNAYMRAISNATSLKSLDSTLNHVLGFSPKFLGITLARQWGLAPEIRYAMGEKCIATNYELLSQSQINEAIKLDMVCSVGETLAKLDNDNDSKFRSIEWNKAKNKILIQIGGKGLLEINKRLNGICKYYLSLIPENFSLTLTKELAPNSSSNSTNSLIQNNSYVRFLPLKIRGIFKKFYLEIAYQTNSRHCINYLVSEVIPKIGFRRGCIYLADQISSTLEPLVAIGDLNSSKFKSKNYLSPNNMKDPILKAFRSSSPIIERQNTTTESSFKYLVGSIGKLQRSGVIYLEPHDTLKDKNEALLIFKALIQAVADCLELD